MANTFELIEAYTATGSVSSIGFSSIPSTYTDLCLKLSLRSAATGNAWDGFDIALNGSSSSFTYRNAYAVPNNTPYSNSGSTGLGGWVDSNSATASTFGNTEIYIPNYAGSTYKSISIDTAIETNATANLLGLQASLWSNTAAINAITITAQGGNLLQHSTAYLYGVKNA